MLFFNTFFLNNFYITLVTVIAGILLIFGLLGELSGVIEGLKSVLSFIISKKECDYSEHIDFEYKSKIEKFNCDIKWGIFKYYKKRMLLKRIKEDAKYYIKYKTETTPKIDLPSHCFLVESINSDKNIYLCYTSFLKNNDIKNIYLTIETPIDISAYQTQVEVVITEKYIDIKNNNNVEIINYPIELPNDIPFTRINITSMFLSGGKIKQSIDGDDKEIIIIKKLNPRENNNPSEKQILFNI